MLTEVGNKAVLAVKELAGNHSRNNLNSPVIYFLEYFESFKYSAQYRQLPFNFCK